MQALIDGRYLLLTGALKTLQIFGLAAILATCVAFTLGILRVSLFPVTRVLAGCVVEFLRGISTVVVLFWLYFALPFLGISLGAETAAVLGLGLVHGAYTSEVVRGALNSVAREQWEAATALSFSRVQALWRLILPQAILLMLPPFGNSLILLLKGTSIASIIAVHELTFQGSLIVTQSLAVTQVFSAVLLIYYTISILTVKGVRQLEQRLSYWRPAV
jgi:polar amino acid transport system permease protein